MKPSTLLSRTVLLALLTLPYVRAEEGGSGHYLPGSMSSFADAVPSSEGFIARLNLASYSGEFEGTRVVPVASLAAYGLEADSFAAGLTCLWSPPIELGGSWSYAMSATIPCVWMDVSASVAVPLPGPGGRTALISRTSSTDGLGDIVLMPLMFNYHANDDLNINFRVAAYAPTGDYEVGRLANTGKNFWTIEPTAALIYLGKENGIEASVFLGADFNFENDDTHYKTGTELHIDGTLAQHFPLFGGTAGVGVNAYWYEQVTADSGSGAKFGDFEGRTAGLGPVLSYSAKLGDVDMITEVKWLHEFETEHRLEGDSIWAKILFKF